MKFKFGYLMLLMALSVAGCAGYFSVWGLSQLFAGASTAVILMASVLEIGKIVTTTALHRYWGDIAKGLRFYLTSGVIILMIITSAGIYGFLSNAYQKTANKVELQDGEIGVLNGKRSLFEKSIVENEKIIVNKNKRIDQLINLRSNQETRLDSAKSNRSKDKARGDIEKATNEIQKVSNDIDGLNFKNSVLSDSVSKYNIKVLELNSNSTVTAEVGPLKYIAELTGVPMGKVVNYLILLLIFVFDPLAIALILMTNRVFQLQREEGLSKPDTTKKVLEDAVISLSSEPEPENVPEPEPENVPVPVAEPEKRTSKVELKDIKEKKEGDRGYSVTIPDKLNRLGSNKVIKNDNTDKIFFKRKKS